MAGVDSILRIVVQNAADELRMGTDEAPRMFRKGAPLKLSIPVTSELTLRHLLGPLFGDDREAELARDGKLDLPYLLDGGEPFRMTLVRRAGGSGFDVLFTRGGELPRSEKRYASVREVQDTPPPQPPSPPPPTVNSQRASGPQPELASLLARAVTMRASDVHLLTGASPSVRVDGALITLDDVRIVEVDEVLSALLGSDEKATLDQRQSIDLALDVAEVGRFRLNVYRAASGLAAAIRVLPRTAPLLESLNLPMALDDLVDLPHGLVLVCGPTGSGKSATLAALAQAALRKRPALLITLEDPIEYPIQPRSGLVRQRQIGRDVRDFPTGLRDALREDPDLLLIGEMRDPETISLALTAAETGHLVLASLHSRSAASSVERIVDSYPAGREQQVRMQLADALRAVVAQRLLPRARGSGRVPALEVLRGTTNVANLIREGKTAQIQTAIQSGRKESMLSLERCLADMIRAGHVTRDAAVAVANDPNALAGYLTAH